MCQACRKDRSVVPCRCPCDSHMRDTHAKPGGDPTKRRPLFQSFLVTCRDCGHVLAVNKLPLPVEQRAIILKKRTISSLTMALGIGMISGGVFVLRSGMWGSLLFFAVLMILGLAVAFAGLDTLLFGYETAQERRERTA